MCVCGAPTAQDVLRKRQLTSEYGRVLRSMVDPWPGMIVFDAAMRCSGERTLGTVQKRKCIRACSGYLVNTIEEMRPERILLFGSDAMTAFVGSGADMGAVRRGVIYYEMPDRSHVPAILLDHPGHASRNSFHRASLARDVAWALNTPVAQLPNAARDLVKSGWWTRVDSDDVLARLIEDVRGAGGMTFDFETFGRACDEDATTLACAITPYGTKHAYVFTNFYTARWQVAIRDLFCNADIAKSNQSVKYDCVWFHGQFGRQVENVQFCTELVRKVQQPDTLAALALQQFRIGMGGGKSQIEEDKAAATAELNAHVRYAERNGLTLGGRTMKAPVREVWTNPALFDTALKRVLAGREPEQYCFGAIPEMTLLAYCARDTVSADILRQSLEASWVTEAGDMQPVWNNMACNLAATFTVMEQNGILVSRKAITDLQAHTDAQIAAAEDGMREWGTFNPNSTDELGALLFDTLGIPYPKGVKPTATGKRALDASVLDRIKHPVIAHIKSWRQAQKFRSQYADAMLAFIQDDGRVHPHYNVSGTETGRPSCRDPNALNIPRPKSAAGKLARDVYTVPPDCDMIELDFSQQELRVACMLSGDPVMLDLFQRGVDFHLTAAKQVAHIFGLKPEDIDADHPLRSRAKTVVFGALYGKTVAGLAEDLNIPVKQAQAIHDAILGNFKVLRAWLQERLREARRNGYCRTWWNGDAFRWRPLYDVADSDERSPDRGTAERSSWNTPIQGTAAEFMNASLCEVQARIVRERLPAKLILTVYDSMLIECHKTETLKVAKMAKSVMESWPSMGVPLVGDCKTGPAWGSLKSVEL
jgi:DNA polymerase I-like protein with 3'-5' exonuclease and polymerase domains/uracil-DNA glycosylase